MLKFLRHLFGMSSVSPQPTSHVAPTNTDLQISQKKSGPRYNDEVLAKHGFHLPASNVDKNHLGQKIEKDGQTERRSPAMKVVFKME